jgi:SIR2-like domain
MASVGIVGLNFLQNSDGNLRNAEGVQTHLPEFFRNIEKIYTYVEDELFNHYSLKKDDLGKINQMYKQIFEFFDKSYKEVHVFTTNYDSVIETYCEQNDYNYTDGFIYEKQSNLIKWNPTTFDEVNIDNSIDNSNVHIFLYKLHGSLSWKLYEGRDIIKYAKGEFNVKNEFITDNALIAPTLTTKNEEKKEPFATLINKFLDYMNKTNISIVIGFSFRDEYITEIFRNYLTRGKLLIVVSPSAKDNLKRSTALSEFLEQEYTNEEDGFMICGEDENLIIHEDELKLENLSELLNKIQKSIKIFETKDTKISSTTDVR